MLSQPEYTNARKLLTLHVKIKVPHALPWCKIRPSSEPAGNRDCVLHLCPPEKAASFLVESSQKNWAQNKQKITLPHSLLGGKEEKRCKALLSPKTEDQLPSSHFEPCLYYHKIWIFLWFFCCVFIVSILQILLDQAGCHQDLSRKDRVGNICQNTIIFNE